MGTPSDAAVIRAALVALNGSAMVSQRLWSPWRMAFLEKDDKGVGGCPFCTTREAARELPGLIVRAGLHAYVILNLFPYNNGHLLVLPFRHVADITDLTADEANELMALLIESRAVLGEVLKTEAFNVGMNLGSAAGAGIPGHLHFHLVPRWAGDTNFMTVTSDTKVLPETLDQTKSRLAEAWRRHSP